MNSSAHANPGDNLKRNGPSTQENVEPTLFGFWIFLMSDAVVFALLFAIYATMMHATVDGPAAGDVVELKSGFIETLLLLVSSFTFGMVSLTLKYRPEHVRTLVIWLLITLLLGVGFVAMELNDFMNLAAQGAVPQRSGFLSAFYALLSTHGLHVSAGCLWLIVLLVQLNVFGIDSPVKIRLMCLALFWHFLDVIWVAIYAVVYLQGVI